MRVAANLSMLFTDVPLLQRYERAASAGFRLVEVSLPYSESAENLRTAADINGLSHVLINAPTGDWTSGFRGIAALASQRAAFNESIQTAIQYAVALNCKKVHFMAGIPKDDDDKRLSEQTFVHNVSRAAKELAEHDLECLIEPINTVTIPGYFLHSYDQALRCMDKIGAPNLKLQFDLFHAAKIEDGLDCPNIDRLTDRIGHIQVAQWPGRGEPDTEGTTDYGKWFKWIKDSDRDWVIGCEYTPTKAGTDTLDWVKKFGLEF